MQIQNHARPQKLISPPRSSSLYDRAWQGLGLHPMACLIILYVCCVAVFFASLKLPRVDGQLTGSDGAFYYSYLPSVIIDHDLDFTNQYARLIPDKVVQKIPSTPEGRPHNKHDIGAAILWLPFFLIGHCIAIGINAAGHPVPLDGMGYIYQVPTLLGSMAYGFAGVLLLYRSCCRFFSRSSSVAASILIWIATNLIYYMIAEPSMAHACSFFAVSLFLQLWLSFRPSPSVPQWIYLGLAGGLVALVREPDATWLALPALDMALSLKGIDRDRVRRDIVGLLVFGISAIVVYMPQLIAWRVLNGSPAKAGYAYSGETIFQWYSPRIVSVLFSLRHGLYVWHPVLLPATAGLVLLWRKSRSVAVSLAVIFLIQIYVVSAWIGWSGGHSFGCRMLVSSLPVLGLGLAAFIDWAAALRIAPALSFVSACLILWNALFFAQYRFGYISKLRPITFYELTAGKFTMMGDLPSRLQNMLRHR